MHDSPRLWLWKTSRVDDDDVVIHQEPAIFQTENLKFGRGISRQTRASTFQVVVPQDQPGTLNDALDLGGGLMMSQKLRTAIESTGITNIEWFPLTVNSLPRNERLMGYSLANVLGAIPCVDFKRSKLQLTARGRIEFIDSLTLLTEGIGDALMFRVAEFLPLVVVREPIKRAVEAAQCRGVEFWRPEELSL